jgi:hypothetical protein
MNKHLRLVLAAALLLFVPFVPRQAQAADINGALAYAPSDSFAVSGVHGDKVKRSQLYKKVLAALLSKKRDKKKLDELKRETGFDPRTDIKSIVAAAPSDVLQDDDAFVVIAEARINERRMLAFMKKEGKKVHKKKGRHGSYYLLGKRQEGALAFRGKFVIVAGAVIIDKALAKQGLAPKIGRAVSRLKRRHVFAVFQPPAKIRREMAKEVPAFGQANLITGGLDIAAGAKLDVVASFDSAKAAQQAELIANEGLKRGAQDRKLKRMKLDGLVNQIKLRRVGRDLQGSLTVSGQQMDRMIKMLTMFL